MHKFEERKVVFKFRFFDISPSGDGGDVAVGTGVGVGGGVGAGEGGVWNSDHAPESYVAYYTSTVFSFFLNYAKSFANDSKTYRICAL